jgi:hypothetical protein
MFAHALLLSVLLKLSSKLLFFFVILSVTKAMHPDAAFEFITVQWTPLNWILNNWVKLSNIVYIAIVSDGESNLNNLFIQVHGFFGTKKS